MAVHEYSGCFGTVDDVLHLFVGPGNMPVQPLFSIFIHPMEGGVGGKKLILVGTHQRSKAMLPDISLYNIGSALEIEWCDVHLADFV